jgi:hypothetical protein
MIPQRRLNDCKCGGHAFHRKINRRYQVYCHECENTTRFWDTMAEAAKEWNTETRYDALDIYYDTSDADIGDGENMYWGT